MTKRIYKSDNVFSSSHKDKSKSPIDFLFSDEMIIKEIQNSKEHPRIVYADPLSLEEPDFPLSQEILDQGRHKFVAEKVKEAKKNGTVLEKSVKIAKTPKEVKQPQPKKSKGEVDPKEEAKNKKRRLLLRRLQKQDELEYLVDITSKHRWNMDMSTEELTKVFSTRMELWGGRNATSITKHIIVSGSALAELLGPYANLDLTGYQQVVSTHPEIDKLLDEMSMKYDSFETLPVELRLAFAMTTTASLLNNHNKQKKLDTKQAKQATPSSPSQSEPNTVDPSSLSSESRIRLSESSLRSDPLKALSEKMGIPLDHQSKLPPTPIDNSKVVMADIKKQYEDL